MERLRVAICDDMQQDRDDLCALVRRYAADRGATGISVSGFPDGEWLLDELLRAARFDIYLLDVLMPGGTGIDLGKAIRKMDPRALIIYHTSSPDFALDAFSVHAERYLLKPVKQAELYEALDHARELCRPRPAERISIKTRSGMVNLDIDDIAFVESHSRALHFTRASGDVVISAYLRSSFEENIAPLLRSGRFIQCHKSFAVNLEWVNSVRAAGFVMAGGQTIPISRSNSAEARRAYLRFIASDER